MMLEERIAELKQIIGGNDGRNAADASFTRAVDELLGALYDDIGQIKRLSTRALFDLFVIKVLYVGRQSRHADVIDYLGALLDGFVFTDALYPRDAEGRLRRRYLSDILDPQKRGEVFESPFDAYRSYADSALFMSGVVPYSLNRRRAGAPGAVRRRAAGGVDSAYYVSTGKTMYRLAARHEDAERQQQRETLGRLADCFEIYVDALNEMSERYIMGFDLDLVADKMLDNFNRYRASRDEHDLTSARRYAALLHLDPARFRALFPGAGRDEP